MKESLHDKIYCNMIQYHISKNKDITFHLPISELKKPYFHDCSIYLDYKQSLAKAGIELNVFLKGYEKHNDKLFLAPKRNEDNKVSFDHPNSHYTSFKQFSSIFL